VGDPVAGPDPPQHFDEKDFNGSLFFARDFIDCGPASGAVDAMSCAWLAGMLVQMSRRILYPVFGICMLKPRRIMPPCALRPLPIKHPYEDRRGSERQRGRAYKGPLAPSLLSSLAQALLHSL
jgi:hypothetical protein